MVPAAAVATRAGPASCGPRAARAPDDASGRAL